MRSEVLIELAAATIAASYAYRRWAMARLTREAILAAKDIETEEVEVPEWGGSVLVRGLTGRERDEWEASMSERRGRKFVPNLANIRAKLVCACVIDDDGKRLFNYGDVQELGEKSSAALDRVYGVAARLSGVSDQDLEELVENFDVTPGAGSSSPSQTTSTPPSGHSLTPWTPES